MQYEIIRYVGPLYSISEVHDTRGDNANIGLERRVYEIGVGGHPKRSRLAERVHYLAFLPTIPRVSSTVID